MRNPSFWHLLMYGCLVINVARLRYISAYNASVKFLLHSYQSMLLCHNIIILANQISGLFDQRYLKTEYTCTIFIFFHKKHTKNCLMLNSIIPKTCKKWPRNGNSQVFKKLYYRLLIRFERLKDLLALTLQVQ